MQEQTTAPTTTEPVTETWLCENEQHHRCRGTVLSVTAAHGMACQCDCHDSDDLAIEARLEADHFGNDPVGF